MGRTSAIPTNNMKQYTVKEIDDALRQVISGDPDFVYTNITSSRCYYYKGPSAPHDGAVDAATGEKIKNAKCDGCVFGQAFQLLGIDKKDLRKHAPVGMVDFQFLPSISERPRYWGYIQRAQDSPGRAWGDLLRHLKQNT